MEDLQMAWCCLNPTKSLRVMTEAEEGVLRQLVVSTILGLDFSDHEIWTKKEIYERLNFTAGHVDKYLAMIYPNTRWNPNEPK